MGRGYRGSRGVGSTWPGPGSCQVPSNFSAPSENPRLAAKMAGQWSGGMGMTTRKAPCFSTRLLDCLISGLTRRSESVLLGNYPMDMRAGTLASPESKIRSNTSLSACLEPVGDCRQRRQRGRQAASTERKTQRRSSLILGPRPVRLLTPQLRRLRARWGLQHPPLPLLSCLRTR